MFVFRDLQVRAREELGQTFVEYALLVSAGVVGVLLATTWSALPDVMQAAMGAVAGAL